MNPLVYFVFALIFLLYGGLNYYIGLRGWQAVFSYIPFLPEKAYWMAFWIVSLAYLASRVGDKLLPSGFTQLLSVTGSYWLGFMFYSFLLLIIIDILRLLNKILHFIPASSQRGPEVGLALFLFLIGLVVYGAWNARHPIVHHYDLQISKRAGTLSQLHVVMVSDIHLGTIIDDGRLSQMVSMVNAQHPDLVLFAGDMVDENVERIIEQEMETYLRQLEAPYGVYAVLGNHEYIGGHVAEAIKYLGESKVSILRDATVKIADSFYVMGRDDMTGARFGGPKRADLQTLLSGLDSSLPIIVLDHQPSHLEEPEEQGVDLQLSGHTHRGQLFPIQLITHKIFQDDFGLLQKGKFQVIVSSGFGTWGPPLRVGNKPEIVDITIHFTK
ncbi:MAG: metallophosphoesterase [Desulfitobacteriaceae bacterium]